MNDERKALENHVNESTPAEIADELESNCDCLHSVKTVCNNANIRLPTAIDQINEAMAELIKLGNPHAITGPLAKAFEAITLTIADMKGNIDPLPVTEGQVVQFLKDESKSRKLFSVSVQFMPACETVKEFYQWSLHDRGHCEVSFKSIAEAQEKLDVCLDQIGGGK